MRGVSKRYGPITAVEDLDLEVQPAEILALLGPNGAGKTTTVEMCEGFVRPDAGTIEVLGLDPVADNARVRARIGVMLQGGGGYPAASSNGWRSPARSSAGRSWSSSTSRPRGWTPRRGWSCGNSSTGCAATACRWC
jgi:hypothetical protein